MLVKPCVASMLSTSPYESAKASGDWITQRVPFHQALVAVRVPELQASTTDLGHVENAAVVADDALPAIGEAGVGARKQTDPVAACERQVVDDPNLIDRPQHNLIGPRLHRSRGAVRGSRH